MVDHRAGKLAAGGKPGWRSDWESRDVRP
jgi:hypothetical protein